MQLKVTTDYAIRTILYLAKTNRITTASEIAETMSIPKNYLVCMISTLRKAGLVGTEFGQKGGYFIGKDPNSITLYDIIILIEGSMQIADMKESESCIWTKAAACSSCSVYTPIQNMLERMLKAVTIGDLLEGHPEGKARADCVILNDIRLPEAQATL